jgi:hypothetical protein
MLHDIECSFQVRRPQNITTGLETFRHIHDKKQRPRDNKRYFNQKEVLFKIKMITSSIKQYLYLCKLIYCYNCLRYTHSITITLTCMLYIVLDMETLFILLFIKR